MKNKLTYLVVITAVLLFISCKNDTSEKSGVIDKNLKKELVNRKTVKKNKAPKKAIVQVDNGDQSIFNRLIFNDKTKFFASTIQSSGLKEMFLNKDKIYTVLAPTNEAFKLLSTENIRILFSDGILLDYIVKNHVVEGKMNYTQIETKIKNNGGIYKIKTLSGSILSATIVNDSIKIKDKNGITANLLTKNISADKSIILEIDHVLGFIK